METEDKDKSKYTMLAVLIINIIISFVTGLLGASMKCNKIVQKEGK